MKHLLTGVAMAAALAIAAPVWAQNAPATPGGNNPTSGTAGPFAPKAAPAPAAPAAAAPAPATPMAAKPMHHKSMRHATHATRVSHRRGHMSSGDRMTEDLNRQELQRIMGGGAPPPAPMPMTPGGNNPTSGSAGPFAPPPPPQR
jgi:uncharacterized protein involved in copper resistance